jgi:streptomycin 6-kinase
MPSRFGFVVSAVGERLSLVMRASPDPDGAHQAQAARVLAELQIAPAVHEVTTTATGTWTVLERVTPGTPLLDIDISAKTLVSLARMLGPLDGVSAPSPSMPSLGDWLRGRLENDSLSELPPGFGVAPRRLRERALSVLRDLEPEAMGQLCHGDASPWNVLAGQGGRTFLVDPRGMRGDVAYDVAVIALKLKQYRSSVTGVVAPNLASLAGIDSERVLAWLEVANAARV